MSTKKILECFTANVITGSQATRELEDNDEELDVIFYYFEDNYIDHSLANSRRRKPKFLISWKNVFNRLQNNQKNNISAYIKVLIIFLQ